MSSNKYTDIIVEIKGQVGIIKVRSRSSPDSQRPYG